MQEMHICNHQSRRARCMATQSEITSTAVPSTAGGRADDVSTYHSSYHTVLHQSPCIMVTAALICLPHAQVLPDSFTQALEHAAQATKLAIDSGSRKCLVRRANA